jgi:hypothetical protein
MTKQASPNNNTQSQACLDLKTMLLPFHIPVTNKNPHINHHLYQHYFPNQQQRDSTQRERCTQKNCLISCSLEDLFFKPPSNLEQLLHTILPSNRHMTLQGIHSANRKKKNETLHQLMLFLTLEKGFLKTKNRHGSERSSSILQLLAIFINANPSCSLLAYESSISSSNSSAPLLDQPTVACYPPLVGYTFFCERKHGGVLVCTEPHLLLQ